MHPSWVASRYFRIRRTAGHTTFEYLLLAGAAEEVITGEKVALPATKLWDFLYLFAPPDRKAAACIAGAIYAVHQLYSFFIIIYER